MTSPVSDAAAAVLAALAHPVRLRILLALEELARTPADLARDLDVPYESVRFAIKALARAELVEVIEVGVTGVNVGHRVYGTPYSGWAELPQLLDKIVASRSPS